MDDETAELIRDKAAESAVYLQSLLPELMRQDPAIAYSKLCGVIEGAIVAFRDATLIDVEAKMDWLFGFQHKANKPSAN